MTAQLITVTPLGISDKLRRLLVRLHQSEYLLQSRDHVTGLQKDGLHFNASGLHRSQRVLSRHTVCAGRNFHRPILRRYREQASF